MNTGIIIKGIGGFYYVDTGSSVVECKARGHFRNRGLAPCVGDKVTIDVSSDGKGAIDTIHPRKNIFVRPPVSNIDSLIIVASLKNPLPDLSFVDKMLVIARAKGVEATICFNKRDLDPDTAHSLLQIYRDAGVRCFETSTLDGIGIEHIRDIVDGKITAFSGFSGVGKSSLLNCITNTQAMQTGEISERLGRGKHTTRHVELIRYNGGYIVDTPGFSMLDFPAEVTKDNLWTYFPEFDNYVDKCKFRDCNHTASSAVCAVTEAYENGDIAASRYTNYVEFYKLLSQRKEWEK